jgi:hypothetical protein
MWWEMVPLLAVLCGELLREAEVLNQRIHPQTICAGWRLAQQGEKSFGRFCQQGCFGRGPRAELIEIAETTPQQQAGYV